MIIGVTILCVFGGAFGSETEDVKRVMAGDPVTLPAALSKLRGKDQIFWYQLNGSDKVPVAHQRENSITFYDNVKGLKDRLMMDNTTGDLTIRNTRPEDSGLYELQMFIQGKESWKAFNVTVCDRLSVPVIIWDCPQNQSAGFSKTECVAMCSVNVSDGTLSWYRNNDLVFNISLSDHPAGFNLSQKVDCLENSTYMCIVSNSFTNQTTHLNITDLCHHSESSKTWKWLLIGGAVLLAVVLLVAVAVFCCKKKKQEAKGFGLCKAMIAAVGSVLGAIGAVVAVCCCKRRGEAKQEGQSSGEDIELEENRNNREEDSALMSETNSGTNV